MASRITDTEKLKSKNAGFTLVEMVVTFALLGLFMVAAMRVISYTVNIYYAAKGADNGVVVSNMVADKAGGLMSGMIEGSSVDAHALDDSVPEGSMLPYITADKDAVFFNDSTNCPVKVGVNEDNELEITYYEKNESDLGVVSYAEIPWYFASDAYMNYEIEDFEITQDLSLYPKNVYILDFTIHSDKFGDFKSSRCIKCYSMPES